MTHRTMSERSYHEATSRSLVKNVLTCSSGVEYSLMVRWVVGLIPNGGPIQLFLVPISASQLI